MIEQFPSAIPGVTISAEQSADGTWTWPGGSGGPWTHDRATEFFVAMVPDGHDMPLPVQVNPPTPTTIAPLDFIRRFTAAEQTTLMATNPLWGVLIAAAPVVDVTDAATINDIHAAVAAGALTQARADQVLDLSASSP